MTTIVRFAPSPTGYLHIGGARTALFNYLFAKNQGGKFLLRIEDTDAKRSNKEAIEAIIEGLDWLGLHHDDEIVFQSKNINRHRQIADELIEKNQAYYCYTSAEELEEMRKNAEKKGEVFRFRSPWRDKINSQHCSTNPVIRIKAPIDQETTIDDLVQGKIVVKNSELDDFVILRSDQTPTYMMAVVVDDFDMKITHIIRGDDHLTNAFRQKIIFDAMNWQVPKFAHIPLIHGSDGAKLSKRHGATSVIEYKKMGYLPQTLRNYLLRLGFSYGDLEIINDCKATEIFTLKNVGKSPARFDFAKLNNLNKHYIKEENQAKLLQLTQEFFAKKPNENEILRIEKAIPFVKERSETLIDLAKNLEIYFDDFSSPINENDQKILIEKRNILTDLATEFEKINDWQIDEIKKNLNLFAENKNLKIKDFGLPLRIAITFSSASAGGIFEVVEILTKKEVLTRIKNVI